MFEDGKRDQDTQEYHTVDSAKLMEFELKHALTGLAHHLFGKGKSILRLCLEFQLHNVLIDCIIKIIYLL